MQEIVDWLEKLGMSEYARGFAENDIDFTILGELTDQDLEKIGVASLGHRRKPLRAIANLEGIEKLILPPRIRAENFRECNCTFLINMNLRSSEHEASFMVLLKRTSATDAFFLAHAAY